MEKHAKQKWDKIYAARTTSAIQPAHVLAEYGYLLPSKGIALDLACGLGGNALFLAQLGLNTHAWDISEQAIDKLSQSFDSHAIQLSARVRDVQEEPPAVNSFDVICVSYFLERKLAENIVAALKPNGLLFYQTFIKENVTEHGPSSPNYRLGENELLDLFAPLHLLVYQELGCVGDVMQGMRDCAMLVAQKR